MKIFFITSKLNFRNVGGSITEFDLMIRTLQKLGSEVTVVTAFSEANDIPEPLPYEVIDENIASRGLIGIQAGIFKILRKHDSAADFFYIDGHNFLYGAGLYRRLGGKVPVSAYFNRELVCWPDGELNFSSQNTNFLIKIKKITRFYIEKYIGTPMANGIDLMLFTNPYLEKSYKNFGVKPKKNNSLIFGDSVDWRKNMKEHGITEDSYVKRNKTDGKLNVFYSSRMVHGKGFDLLIKAFAKLKNKEKFNLILGGTGPEESLIRQMIKDLKIEKYVEMPGWVLKEQVFENYKKADIFVQARWRKDMTSMSLIDAMTFGVPSILPKGGGLEWDAKNSALYFKDGDIDDLAQKIEQLGNDQALRAKLSRECYVRLAEDEMNHEKQTERWYNRMKEIKAEQKI